MVEWDENASKYNSGNPGLYLFFPIGIKELGWGGARGGRELKYATSDVLILEMIFESKINKDLWDFDFSCYPL